MDSKSRLYTSLGLIIFAVSSLSVVRAQQGQEKPKADMPCDGGLLNSKVIFEAKPLYSAEAKRAKAEGNVAVRVRVDEEGKVYEATACLGHQLLRKSAVRAAYRTRISPTLLSDRAVKVAGVLLYIFKPGEETGKLSSP